MQDSTETPTSRTRRILNWARGKLAASPQPQPGPDVLRGPRLTALVMIAALVAAASAVSFAESYRGLYDWAREHGLSGDWAVIWPLQIDVFIAVGELALFVALVDRWASRSRTAAWTVTALGLAVSVAGNVGHVTAGTLAARLTAAVPPLAAAAALAVGLGVLKRVVEHHHRAAAPEPEQTVLDRVPSDVLEAAKARLRFALAHGFRVTDNELHDKFSLTRAQATTARQDVLAESNGHGPHV